MNVIIIRDITHRLYVCFIVVSYNIVLDICCNKHYIAFNMLVRSDSAYVTTPPPEVAAQGLNVRVRE